MPRSISTRTGDDGTTGLLYGQRVPKDHPQIEAVGNLDEFNAALGLARAADPDAGRRAELERIQHDLVAFMGEIACAEADADRHAASKFTRVDAAALARLDAAVAALEAKQPPAAGWATPGANPAAAAFDLARTLARRVERRLVALPRHGKTVRPLLLQYLNRVSDLLWLLARDAEGGPPAPR
ncbi:MAG TPA: cob(I)yrinic acid a,c-diamide adenosyltransferase [Opitutaceae bacterium]|nr:cob(I)yrinic acid a,c-diamide adenosyltransferase [Opitutaceae bacterium]